MAAPIWVTGQVLTAADVNSWFAPLAAVKTADQSVTSSTTLVNDTQLFVPVTASSVYKVEAIIWYTGGSPGTSDIKYTFTMPAGASTPAIRQLGLSTALAFQYFGVSSGGAFGSNGAGQIPFELSFLLTVGVTPGNLQLQWAQNTSSATSTVVKAGSVINLIRVI